MSALDVVRWARNSWLVRKPWAKGSPLVPIGSPGMCRVVMLAPTTAVQILRQLRDPALCVVLEEEGQVNNKNRSSLCLGTGKYLVNDCVCRNRSVLAHVEGRYACRRGGGSCRVYL